MKNKVYYNLSDNTAFKVYSMFCGIANIKPVKVNTGRPKMYSSYETKNVSDIEKQIQSGQIIKIFRPKELLKEVTIYKSLFNI